MQKYVLAYVTALVAMMVIDGLWLGLVARDFYKTQMGPLMAPTPRWGAAIAFYLLYPLGLVFFVVSPTLKEQSLMAALLAGAFFGLIAYATYDLSNLAVTNGWPTTLAMVDMAWGAALTGVACALAWLVAARFG